MASTGRLTIESAGRATELEWKLICDGCLRMSIGAMHSTALTTPVLLQGIDLHYETENRLVWNAQERRNEEREFVYEISWIPELNTWRCFLRTQKSR